VPVALYLHESQLLHPPSPNGAHDDGPAWTQWRSMAAADRVWCNSGFHRDALLAALPGFVGTAPDRGHDDLVAAVAARTAVLPVGVDVAPLIGATRPPDDGDDPLIVWNQRWDHDKDPQALFRVLRALARDGVAFRLALAGENRRVDPREFAAVRADLGGRVVHAGHLPRPAYRDLLLRAAVTVSTARHEFFGIAAVEAMAAGCVPLLPRRLAYPELVPGRFHDDVLYPGRLYERLAGVLTDVAGARRRIDGLRAAMRMHDWSVVGPQYDDALEALAAGRPPPDAGDGDGEPQPRVSTP
jgi:glycosyltransferase involved in cell wall biosynthesis